MRRNVYHWTKDWKLMQHVMTSSLDLEWQGNENKAKAEKTKPSHEARLLSARIGPTWRCRSNTNLRAEGLGTTFEPPKFHSGDFGRRRRLCSCQKRALWWHKGQTLFQGGTNIRSLASRHKDDIVAIIEHPAFSALFPHFRTPSLNVGRRAAGFRYVLAAGVGS